MCELSRFERHFVSLEWLIHMSSTAFLRAGVESARGGSNEQADPPWRPISAWSNSASRTISPASTVWEDLQPGPCTPRRLCLGASLGRPWLGPEGGELVIAVGHCCRWPRLVPLAVRHERRFGLSVLRWLGQSHANYNMGLFAPGIAVALTGDDLSPVARCASQRPPRMPLCSRNPFTVDSIVNPFAKLPHQNAPSSGFAVTLGDFETM